MTIRGIRNNNPGNLGYNAFTQGLGATGVEPEGRFAVFPTMQAGVCALAKNLINYQDAHGIHTVSEAISRWAPGNENNTAAYISFVDGVLGCKPDDQFDFHNPDFLFWMVTAIGEEECGHDAFTQGVSDADITAGVQLALTT
jgi:hypothetical protein